VSSANRKVQKVERTMAIQEASPPMEFDKSALFAQEFIQEGREEAKKDIQKDSDREPIKHCVR
jgi:hypothetical protein